MGTPPNHLYTPQKYNQLQNEIKGAGSEIRQPLPPHTSDLHSSREVRTDSAEERTAKPNKEANAHDRDYDRPSVICNARDIIGNRLQHAVSTGNYIRVNSCRRNICAGCSVSESRSSSERDSRKEGKHLFHDINPL